MAKGTKIIKRGNEFHLISHHEYIPEKTWGIEAQEIKIIMVSHYTSGGILEGEQIIIHHEKQNNLHRTYRRS